MAAEQPTDKKSYYFLVKKTMKRQIGSVWDFPQPPALVCSSCMNPYFKINTPLFCCPLFFKECLNPQVRIKKMANEDSANSYLVSFGRNIKDTSSHISIKSLGLYPSSENLSNFFLKLYIPLVGKKIKIYDVQITGKSIGYLENWK